MISRWMTFARGSGWNSGAGKRASHSGIPQLQRRDAKVPAAQENSHRLMPRRQGLASHPDNQF